MYHDSILQIGQEPNVCLELVFEFTLTFFMDDLLYTTCDISGIVLDKACVLCICWGSHREEFSVKR